MTRVEALGQLESAIASARWVRHNAYTQAASYPVGLKPRQQARVAITICRPYYSSVRRAIRRCEKVGVEVTPGLLFRLWGIR